MIHTMERKIKLKSLNPHISCKICKGYLIDATTVTECLHTFCKSCLIKHLEEKNTCPSCHIVIHQSHPLNYISYDRTMQDIVFKLAPNLQQNEMKREKEFYKKRGLPYPKANAVQTQEKDVVRSFSQKERIDKNCVNGDSNHLFGKEDGKKTDCHRSDEQINILIENFPGSSLKSVKRKFIRCSSHTTVTHIKKFVAKKVFNNFDRYKEIDILCDGQPLGKDHTLKFISVTKWRFRDPPLKLTYSPRQEF